MKGFFAGLSVIVFFLTLSGVFAVTCNDDQRLFRIEDVVNSHGEEYNGTVYLKEICFTDYYVEEYTESNPHGCDGEDNIVLKFSDATNAHAEKPDGTNFNVDVCYGDLACELIDDEPGEECDGYTVGGQKSSFIVSLSSEENSHLALSNRYDWSLCCVSSIEPICNHNNYCDEGETKENCPSDNCGLNCEPDGIKASYESCDCGLDPDSCSSVQLGEKTCESLGEGGGNLMCTDDCRFDTSGCGSPDELFCMENGLYHMYPCNGETCAVTACAHYGLIDTLPPGYGGNLADFRKESCQKCTGVANTDPSGDPSASSHTCEWDDSTGACSLVDIYAGDLRCRVNWVSEGTCGPDDVSRDVDINSIKIGGVGTCPGAETKTIPCGEVVEFSFFGGFEFVFALLMVSLVYAVYLAKRK